MYKRNRKNLCILGFGAAEGGELEKVALYSKQICIVDPTKKMRGSDVNGVKITYYMPTKDGKLCFEDETFDLITCFGVLMYIMNPEVVVKELIRVLKKDGILLIREPSTDMHVNEKCKREGMGKFSRGLPPEFYRELLKDERVRYEMTHCMFSPWIKIGEKIINEPLNHKWFVVIDSLCCKMFRWNWKYQRKKFRDKFAPGSLFVRIMK